MGENFLKIYKEWIWENTCIYQWHFHDQPCKKQGQLHIPYINSVLLLRWRYLKLNTSFLTNVIIFQSYAFWRMSYAFLNVYLNI